MENKNRVWKIVGIVLLSAIVIFSLFAWWGFRLEEQDKNLLTNQNNNNMKSLTAENIKEFKYVTDPGAGDYFAGSTEEKKNIVDAFVADNSMSDPTYLYIATNTAARIGDTKSAFFLFYAARIRKDFDLKRYGMSSESNGNNAQTYWAAMDMADGAYVNPAIIKNLQEFSEAIEMIKAWQVVPSDEALYDKEDYGDYKISKDKWSALATDSKKKYIDSANKLIEMYKDPKNNEAFNFVQDYNFGKIPHNSENDKKYQEYLVIVKKALGQ